MTPKMVVSFPSQVSHPGCWFSPLTPKPKPVFGTLFLRVPSRGGGTCRLPEGGVTKGHVRSAPEATAVPSYTDLRQRGRARRYEWSRRPTHRPMAERKLVFVRKMNRNPQGRFLAQVVRFLPEALVGNCTELGRSERNSAGARCWHWPCRLLRSQGEVGVKLREREHPHSSRFSTYGVKTLWVG